MVLLITMLVWTGLGILIFCSRKEEGTFLHRVSLYLYKKCIRRLSGSSFRQMILLKQRLTALQPGVMPDKLVADYYTEKIRMVLLVIMVGSVAACSVDWSVGQDELLQKDGVLKRPEKARAVTLDAYISNEEKMLSEQIRFEVEERILTDREAQQCYEELLPVLEQNILGENVSLEQVNKKLQLPDEVEGYPFWIEWRSSDPAHLSADGSVSVEELQEPIRISLTAMFYYKNNEWEKNWGIVLCPPVRTAEEQALYDLSVLLETNAEAQKYEEKLKLPSFVGDWSVSWEIQKDPSGGIVLMLTFAAAALVFYMKDQDLQKDLEKRRRKMRLEYGVFVNRYALLLEAGLTVRGSFLKICEEHYGKEGQNKNPLYEEMHYSCNELKAGISESKVYENFGRRTGLQEYARLCALINQSLKKGNTALVRRLKEEGEDALTENLRWKKKIGEEAGTKLLAPMGMMLIMVLVMIILPAFSGIGI